MTNRVAATASAVTLTLTTNIIVVTVTPAAPNNQVTAPLPGVLVRAECVVTGAASATNATVSIVRGSAAGGTNILASAVVQPVTTGATDTTIVVSAIETVANFNAANGIYSLQVNQAGAGTTARIATIELQPLSAGG